MRRDSIRLLMRVFRLSSQGYVIRTERLTPEDEYHARMRKHYEPRW
jgi:hypothetical protein